MTRAAKATPMCCVTIGYSSYLMPVDKGLKLIELLQHAVTCKQGYECGPTYACGEQPHAELAMVRPDQIRAPEGALEPAGAPRKRSLRYLAR